MPMSPPQPEPPALAGIDPPRRLLLVFGLELGGQPALGIPGLDLADLADLAVCARSSRASITIGKPV